MVANEVEYVFILLAWDRHQELQSVPTSQPSDMMGIVAMIHAIGHVALAHTLVNQASTCHNSSWKTHGELSTLAVVF